MDTDLQIYTHAQNVISDYETRPIEILPGLYFKQYQVIKMAEFYSNSRYMQNGGLIDGVVGPAEGVNKDAMGRDMPFYNIVNYRVTLAKVATDLDIKDVQIGSDDPLHYVHAMLLQKEAYEWMKGAGFAKFLNDMGQKRPKYGGVLVKRTFEEDKNGKEQLKIDTCDWRNIATDQVVTLGGAIVETHYMTPVDLMKKDGVWTLSDLTEVIEENEKQMGMESGQYGDQQETYNSDRIIVREITGQFPMSYYTEVENAAAEGDDDFEGEYYDDDGDPAFTYRLQHYFIADINGKPFPLYCEQMKDADFQYKYLPWEEMPGRGLGRGVIEDAEEAQVWTNDAVVNEKNAMDLAGKVVVKTTSKQVGGNILEIDNGRIFELEMNADLEAVQLNPAALGEFQNQIEKWQSQANDATSSYDANSGKQPPADTPYSQTALLNQVAAKPFDYRREEAGTFVTEIFTDWVIPWLVVQIEDDHKLATEYTQDELEVIDAAFANYQVNEKVIPLVMSGEVVSQEQYDSAIAAVRAQLAGSRRYLQVPKGFFDDVIPKVTVLTTGEQKNKAAILQSLSTILGDVMKTYDPNSHTFAILQDPVMARIFGTILELSGAGISPVSLGIGKPAAPAPGMPGMASMTQSPTGQPPAPLTAPISAGGNPSALNPSANVAPTPVAA